MADFWDAPGGREGFGRCVVHPMEGGTRLFVERADDLVLFSGGVVRAALGCGPGWERLADRPLVIDGVNERVAYRIGKYHPFRDVYEALKVDG